MQLAWLTTSTSTISMIWLLGLLVLPFAAREEHSTAGAAVAGGAVQAAGLAPDTRLPPTTIPATLLQQGMQGRLHAREVCGSGRARTWCLQEAAPAAATSRGHCCRRLPHLPRAEGQAQEQRQQARARTEGMVGSAGSSCSPGHRLQRGVWDTTTRLARQQAMERSS